MTNKNFSLIPKILFGFSILINILFCLIIFSSLNDRQLAVYLNSDTLYLPSIYRDLFIDHNGIQGWHLNGAPNIFPDMLIYFVLNRLFVHFIPAMLSYSILQIILLFLLLSVLYRQFFPSMGYLQLSVGSMLMSLFLLVTFFGGRDFVYTFFMLSVSFHVSAFLMTLLSLILLLNYLRSGRMVFLIILFIVAVISVINDRLYMALFSLPCLALFLFIFRKTEYSRRLEVILLSDIVSGITGLILFDRLRFHSPVRIIGVGGKIGSFENIRESVRVFLEQHSYYLTRMDLRGIIDLLFIFSIIFHLSILVKKMRLYFRRDDVDFFELIYLTMFLSVSLIGLIMPVINGSYIGWDIIRYNIYSLYLGIFSFAYLTYKVVEVYRIPHSYLSVFTGILFSILLVVAAQEVRKSRIRSGLSEVVDYYPARVAQIDSLSRAYHLKNGIASYWDAKYITMFSRENLRLVTVYSDFKPWYHVMNQNWYCFEDQSHETPRRFTFLVQGDIRNDCIEKCLGSPIKTISCSGEKQILIFRPFSFDRKKEEIFYPGD